MADILLFSGKSFCCRALARPKGVFMKVNFKWSDLFPLALGVCLLITFASCGSDNNDNNNDSGGGSTNPPQQEESQGRFTTNLNPENPGVSQATGTAEFTLEGDNFTA